MLCILSDILYFFIYKIYYIIDVIFVILYQCYILFNLILCLITIINDYLEKSITYTYGHNPNYGQLRSTLTRRTRI